jgi:mitochondrial inner membrane protease subunit 2
MGVLIRTSWWALVGVCAAATIKDNIVDLSPVYGTSMAPTLSPNAHETGSSDVVLVKKRSVLGGDKDLARGDIVFFWSFRNPDRVSVKRIVATAGDTVYPSKRARYGAGYREIDEETTALDVARDLVKSRGKLKASEPVTVPYNHVWVEGDNSESSLDSRDYGPVSVEGVCKFALTRHFTNGAVDITSTDHWKDKLYCLAYASCWAYRDRTFQVEDAS